MEANTRALFEIVALDLNTDKIVFEDKVVAEGEKEALFESELKSALKNQGLKRDDVHIIVREFGKVPAIQKIHNFKVLGQVAGHVLAKEEK